MNKQTGTILIIFIMTLYGCVGSLVPVIRIDDETEHRLSKEIVIYENENLKSLEYRRVGPVEATSCKNKIWDPPASRENAIAQLRYKTSAMGGNAISNLLCEGREGPNLAKNCWTSITCYAVAINILSDTKNIHSENISENAPYEKMQVIPVKVIGYSPKTTDKNIKIDSQRAMIDAKIKAIETAGVKIESSTLVKNFELLFDFVESQSKGVLLPGFEFVEFGYDENGVYKVLLIGNIQSLR